MALKPQDKFDRFIKKHEDLVEAYEMVVGEDISTSIDEVSLKLADLCKRNKTLDFNTILKHAVERCIEEGDTLGNIIPDIVEHVNSSDANIIQTYFNEVGKLYKKHKNNYHVDFELVDRDTMITLNLKSVISIAKQYQGLGVPLEDLISAGNIGLINAYDKFDPKRSKTKTSLLEAVGACGDKIPSDKLMDIFSSHFKYGTILEQITSWCESKEFHKKSDIISWINDNVGKAKFSSAATFSIRGAILKEINDHSRTVYKPKKEVDEDREKDGGVFRVDYNADIEAPINGDSGLVFGDTLDIHEDVDDVESQYSKAEFKHKLMLIMEGMSPRERSIILKRFGIGLPRPLQPKEVADQEGISVARVTQLFNQSMQTMKDNCFKHGLEFADLYELCKDII